MEILQRMVPLPGGKRAGIKLDEPTWAAIDWLSEKAEKTWQQWCADVIDRTPDHENLTAAVRAAAMESVLDETIFNERAEGFSGLHAAGFRQAGLCHIGRDFDEAKDQAIIEGKADLTSVEVMSGIDEHGHVAYYIRNKLADAPHMIISTPFTPMQWLDAVGA